MNYWNKIKPSLKFYETCYFGTLNREKQMFNVNSRWASRDLACSICISFHLKSHHRAVGMHFSEIYQTYNWTLTK